MDKRCLVIGGTRGIGRGIVEAFAREGASVVFTGRDADAAAEVCDGLARARHTPRFDASDATDLAAVRRAITNAFRNLAGLDVLVNNAGSNKPGSLLDAEPDDYELLFALNTRATFFSMQTAARLMVESGGGSIVNITSSAATRGYRDRTVYCGTKAAVLMMSKAAALDVAPQGVRINCISPGAVDTPLLRHLHASHAGSSTHEDALVEEFGSSLTPIGRVGTVADVAAAAVFFASDESSWITGAELNVDGGVTI